MLLWGVDCPGEKHGALREALKRELLVTFRENRGSCTEPDVVVLAGDWLLFVEVKYRSPNSRPRAYLHFDRYLEVDRHVFSAEPSRVKADGYEELVRNWAVGSSLARTLGKRFSLVNLAGTACAASAARFAESLEQTSDRIFCHVTWPALLGRLKRPIEPWFTAYLERKGLLPPSGQ